MTEQSQPTFATGDVIAKKYEIVRFMGEGKSAHTYLARHMATGKELVIKFFREALVAAPKDKDRLRQNFERARGLRNDLLVRYGELGIHGDLVYVTEEYFASETMRELIDGFVAENKPFTIQEACQIIISVLEAAEVAHSAGIIHRNLKPENVLVNTKRTGPAANAKILRTIKITGTGLAGVITPSVAVESLEGREETPYLAPELSGYDQDCGPQADVYSVGVMLYELLCGQRPIGTYISPTQMREDLPEHIDDIVEIALAHSAEDRYPTARDMINDIQRSFSLEMQAGRTVVSFRNIMLSLGVAIAAAVAVGTWLLAGEKPDPVAEARRQDDMVRRNVVSQNPVPDPQLIKTMLEKRTEMVYVPQGTFVAGRYGGEAPDVATATEPLREVRKTDAFFIDRFEFPNKQGSRPAVRVTWNAAADACASIGKRLCSADEWERACKGTGNLIYAYGDTYNPACTVEPGEDYRLGDRAECVSGYGVWDLSSGLTEWTSTPNPTKEGRKFVKGGLRANPVRGHRCAFGVDESSGLTNSTLGFRCCLNGDGTLGPVSVPPEAAAPADPAAAPADPAAPVPAAP